MPIRQSFSWWCYANRGVEPRELLKAAKEIGFEAVELVPEEMFGMVREAGLVIASHPGHQGISSGLNDLAQHNRIESEIIRHLELAKEYRIPNLIVFSGERRAGLSEQEGIDNSIAGLRRVARAAEEASVYLCMELLNSKVDHGGYQCDTTPWGVRVCEGVGSPRVALLYDIYHMQIMEGDVIRTIRTHGNWFFHYHTAGNPGRNDLDDTQELNYRPIMRAILETGYDGYVGHEFVPKGEVIPALRAAYELCDV